ncbi:MAG: hypothetical protein OEZ59_04635 [Deltaproteobacteria bacterium]|nr:hypothetical protein [Deltaproteobacteria bacterium]
MFESRLKAAEKESANKSSNKKNVIIMAALVNPRPKKNENRNSPHRKQIIFLSYNNTGVGIADSGMAVILRG